MNVINEPASRVWNFVCVSNEMSIFDKKYTSLAQFDDLFHYD